MTADTRDAVRLFELVVKAKQQDLARSRPVPGPQGLVNRTRVEPGHELCELDDRTVAPETYLEPQVRGGRVPVGEGPEAGGASMPGAGDALGVVPPAAHLPATAA